MGNSSSQEEKPPTPGAGAQHHNPSLRQAAALGRQRPGGSKRKEEDGIPVPSQFENSEALPIPGVVTQATTTTSTTTGSFAHDEFVEHVEHSTPSKEDESNTSTATSTPARPVYPRRKSAILLDDNELDEDLSKLRLKEGTPVQPSSIFEYASTDGLEGGEEYSGPKYDTVLSWVQGGSKVYVTGSFTGWRKMIKLTRQENGEFSVVLKLPAGTHRLRFVVDNELRCSDYLATATDSMGNLVNYIEVGPPEVAEVSQDALTSDGYERVGEEESLVPEPHLEYCREIPEVFTNAEVMDRFVSSDFVTPPMLPPHLEGVILNSNSTEKDNNSVLPIPNHVVLNHLATTSIKHNVLAVASISRYSRKYVTQVLYAPLQ
ncbi:SNF1 protein kinase subunit beta-2 [Trichomonascus vanleenenianus]|uniref:Sip2p n=1 Tax=Trichomonascus vanleenenianus TaxID=2268995 RepID=UPI003ECAE128